MDRPTCETCPYFTGNDNDEEYGECRANGPVLTPIDRVNELGHGGVEYGMWPRLMFDKWCGQHPDFPAYIAARKAQPVDPGEAVAEAPLTTAEVANDSWLMDAAARKAPLMATEGGEP